MKSSFSLELDGGVYSPSKEVCCCSSLAPKKSGAFAWKDGWGKNPNLLLTHKIVVLVSYCYMCKKSEESVANLLIHYRMVM